MFSFCLTCTFLSYFLSQLRAVFSVALWLAVGRLFLFFFFSDSYIPLALVFFFLARYVQCFQFHYGWRWGDSFCYFFLLCTFSSFCLLRQCLLFRNGERGEGEESGGSEGGEKQHKTMSLRQEVLREEIKAPPPHLGSEACESLISSLPAPPNVMT